MDFLTSLVNSMPGAVAQGLIWGIMAIGVYITYRVLDVADLTVDGSLGTGGAVCVVLVLNGVPVGVALVAATLAGMLAGLVTGLFHTACGIPAILAGILTQLALYSVNLRIMAPARAAARQTCHQCGQVQPAGLGPLCPRAGAQQPDLRAAHLLRGPDRRAVLVLRHGAWLLAARYRRKPAHGPRPGHQHERHHRARPYGFQRPCGAGGRSAVPVPGFSDINMGRGAIVIGLAAVIIGEVIFGKIFRNFALKLTAAVIGAIIYYIVMNFVLRMGLSTDDLKLLTALVVAVFLTIPYWKGKYFTKVPVKKGGKDNA